MGDLMKHGRTHHHPWGGPRERISHHEQSPNIVSIPLCLSVHGSRSSRLLEFATTMRLPLRPASPALLHVFSLILTAQQAEASFFGFTSYANIFFEPAHVVNNSWFAESYWAQDMSVAWADTMMRTGPWCGSRDRAKGISC